MIRLKKDMETIKVENTGNIAGVIHKEIILTPAEMLDKAYMFNRIIRMTASASGIRASGNPTCNALSTAAFTMGMICG